MQAISLLYPTPKTIMVGHLSNFLQPTLSLIPYTMPQTTIIVAIALVVAARIIVASKIIAVNTRRFPIANFALRSGPQLHP